MTTQEIKRKVAPVFRTKGVSFAALFGSRARGENREDSDIDILVKFSAPVGLFDFVGLEKELSESLGQKVDLVTERGLHHLIKTRILQELEPLYGQR